MLGSEPRLFQVLTPSTFVHVTKYSPWLPAESSLNYIAIDCGHHISLLKAKTDAISRHIEYLTSPTLAKNNYIGIKSMFILAMLPFALPIF